MARTRNRVARHRKHKEILKRAKGFIGGRRRLYKSAKETVEKGLLYAYRDRKVKKRNFRRLWIVRINAACRNNGTTYSRFMKDLDRKGIDLNRKALADLAVRDPNAFAELVQTVKRT